MCGITGYYSLKNKIALDKYYDAHKLLSHRGPDDEGFVALHNNNISEYKGDDTIEHFSSLNHIKELGATNVVLGQRRLSIIDLSKNGHQPYIYENLFLVYNGEIFNYIEIREELIKKGYNFITDTDTEVFLKAYDCYGYDCFNMFNGMWSAAIYDSKKNTIILVRDRFGIKPLYYSILNNNLYFGSEVKFILPFHEEIKSNFNMVYDYIEHNNIWHSSETMFENINQIDPGFIMEFNGIDVNFKEYYNILKIKKKSTKSIKKIFKDSVNLRLRSDVQVGTMLSGGIDSTLITSYAKKIKKDLKTYSIIFGDGKTDPEINFMKNTSKSLDLDSDYIKIEHNSYSSEDLIKTIEFPFRSFTVPSQRKLFEHVKKTSDVKVLLSGEGADEVFSGYNIHAYIYIISLIKKINFKKAIYEIHHLSILKNISLVSLLLTLFKTWLSISKNKFICFFRNGLKNKLSHFDKIKTYEKPVMYSKDIFDDYLYSSLVKSSLREYLMYSDLNSMKYSIEVRVPFMDYRLIEKGFAINNNTKVTKGLPKQPLRREFKNIISDEILKRKDKKGFFTPYEEWMNNELIPELDSCFYNIKLSERFNYINYEKLLKSYELFKVGKGKKDYTFFWRMFLLHKWKTVWKVKN